MKHNEPIPPKAEEEIARPEEQELCKSLKKAGRILQKIPEKEIIRAVRESRDER